MRLSEWRKQAPIPECVSKPVIAMIEGVLGDLGVAPNVDCWVLWGDDPGMRYSILAPSLAGMASVAVRPVGGHDGPRATGKLTRWSKLTVSELSVDAAGGHRIVALQVESFVLKGMDDEADRICNFVRSLVAGIENRTVAVQPIVRLAGVAPAPIAETVPARVAARAPGHVASAQDESLMAGNLSPAVVEANAPAAPRAQRSQRAQRLQKAPRAMRAPRLRPVSGPDSAPTGDAPPVAIEEPREVVAAKRRAAAAAILMPDLAPIDGADGGSGGRAPEAVVGLRPVAASPVPATPAPVPVPAAATPVPVLVPPAPPAPAPMVAPPAPPDRALPAREQWIPPHPIGEVSPTPKKPRRWTP